MKSFIQTLLLIVVILVLAVIAELITPLRQLTDYLNVHPQPYKAITIGASILGWILLGGVIAFGLWTQGKPMNNDEALRFMEDGAGSPTVHRRIRGRAKGREFRTEVSFKEIKESWQDGSWKQEPGLLSAIIGLFAVALIALGMFGFFFVIGQPLIKMLCGGALLYAAARTAWAFWKA